MNQSILKTELLHAGMICKAGMSSDLYNRKWGKTCIIVWSFQSVNSGSEPTVIYRVIKSNITFTIRTHYIPLWRMMVNVSKVFLSLSICIAKIFFALNFAIYKKNIFLFTIWAFTDKEFCSGSANAQYVEFKSMIKT